MVLISRLERTLNIQKDKIIDQLKQINQIVLVIIVLWIIRNIEWYIFSLYMQELFDNFKILIFKIWICLYERLKIKSFLKLKIIEDSL